jgi:hypothetical protein
MRWLAFCVLLALPVPGWAQERAQEQQQQPRPGLPVDAKGGPTIDPTENVKALNEAGLKAIHDLQVEIVKRLESEIQHVKEVGRLQKELSDAEVRRIDENARTVALWQSKLAEAESSRINAIRQVDVGAVVSANEKSNATATTLATQVAQSAADNRALVATTAATQSATQQQQFADVVKRISSLEQTQSTNIGKQTYQDPQITAMATQIAQLVAHQADSNGQGTGQSNTIGYIALAAGIAIAGGSLLFSIMRKPDPALTALVAEIERARAGSRA